MIKIEVFEPKHISDFQPMEKRDCINLQKGLNYYRDTDYHVLTVWVHDKILFIGGVLLVKKGVAEFFLHRSKSISKCKKTLVQTCKMLIDRSFDDFDLHRLQMITDDSIPETGKWAKVLGFKKEFTLDNYVAPNMSATMNVRFMEDM